MNFNSIGTQHLQHFQAILPLSAIKPLTLVSPENNDQTGILTGNSKLCLQPSSATEVSKILSYCNSENLPVCIQGGNSGLVGGSVPIKDELVLSLAKMNQINKFDSGKEILTCEAGCIMQNVQDYIKPYGYELPWDLGAKGSAQIGGNLATHVGGLTFIRHGPLRGHITGMEVVLANGEILNLLSELRKDNTGIDLKQLFIGSEGLLGVITKCNIVCARRKKNNLLILLKCDKFEDILNIREVARSIFGSEISALEFMDSYSMDNVLKFIPGTRNPFGENQRFGVYYLVLQIGSDHQIGMEILENFSQKLEVNCQNIDCLIASNQKQAEEIWNIRESIGTASKYRGKCIKFDISLPLEKMDQLATEVRMMVKDSAFLVSYGHIGDGNQHINISMLKEYEYKTIAEKSTKLIYEYCRSMKGSISAEHGIGSFKKRFLNFTKPDNAIQQMKSIKKLYDPKGILNPYKVFI